MGRGGVYLFGLLISCGPIGATVKGDPGACIVEQTYCYDRVDDRDCREIGIQEGDVLFHSDQTCSQRDYTLSCPGEGRRLYQSCP